MKKQKSATKIKKTTGFSAEIQNLHHCIEKDYTNLAKAYSQSLTKVKKAIDASGQMLKKMKKKPAKSAKNKPVKSDLMAIKSIQSQLVALKAEQATLSMGQKKLAGQQKVLKQFEKTWAKESKAKIKKAKTSKTRKKKISESEASTQINLL